HAEPELRRRLENCRQHFGLTFRLLDRLPLAPGEREAIKTHFFGREILDILGADDAVRSERHELLSTWQARLVRAGFQLARAPEAPPIAESRLTPVEVSPGRVVIRHEGVPLTGVLWAVPSRAR